MLPWVVAAFGFSSTFRDNSYLWHVIAGRIQIDGGAVLTSDPFSFTFGGSPWRTQSWLAELLYAPLDEFFGFAAAPLITMLCAAIVFIFLGLLSYGRTRSVISVVVYLVLTAVAFAAFLNPRPAIFSFPLFAAIVLAANDRHLRWVVPLLMWVWASVHGSFVIGLAYLLLHMVGRGLAKRSIVQLIAFALPTLLTAHGWGIVDMLTAFVRNRSAVQMMSEWQSPDLLSPPFIPVLIGFMALVWLAQRDLIDYTDWWILVPFMAMAVSANRSVPPAWIGLAPILTRLSIPIRSARQGGLSAVLLAAVLAVVPFALRSEEEVDASRFPVAAAEHITSERVFHDDASGGWLIYMQWPKRLVYIDDRAELYGDNMEVFRDVRDGNPIWREEFERWAIEEALVRKGTPLAEILQLNGWVVSFDDEQFVVLKDMN